MTRRHTTYETFESSSDQKRRLLREEELILDVIDKLNEAINSEEISKTELADRLACTKGFVSQILSGGRNLTLRTIADVADALDYDPQFQIVKKSCLSQATSKKHLGCQVVRVYSWDKDDPVEFDVVKKTISSVPARRGGKASLMKVSLMEGAM